MVGSSTGKFPILFIQFARSPILGGVKTRLTPVLSATQALSLHLKLLRHTTKRLLDSDLGAVELWFSDETDLQDISAFVDKGLYTVKFQSGENLGQRMCAAMLSGLKQADKVVLVGSDCPSIDSNYLMAAIAGLDNRDIVLGPASDGGYVLIASKRCCPAIFLNINWGSECVLKQTINNIETMKWTYSLLDVLDDIDRPEDLTLLDNFGIKISDELNFSS